MPTGRAREAETSRDRDGIELASKESAIAAHKRANLPDSRRQYWGSGLGHQDLRGLAD